MGEGWKVVAYLHRYLHPSLVPYLHMAWPRRRWQRDGSGGLPVAPPLTCLYSGRIVHASSPIRAYLERAWKDRGGRERLFIYPSGANDLKDLGRLLHHNALSGLPLSLPVLVLAPPFVLAPSCGRRRNICAKRRERDLRAGPARCRA